MDSAFSLYPDDVITQLHNDTDQLRKVLRHHFIRGTVQVEELLNEQLLTTTSHNSSKLRVNVYKHGADEEPIVTINGAKIKRGNKMATNGFVHVVDRFLFPMAQLSIMEHLATCEVLKGAQIAFTGTGLKSVLEQDGPFTVFLPTTEAFGAVDNKTVDSFMQNISTLQSVLTYHIVDGTYFSEGLRDGMWLPTLHREQELQVQVTTDGYTRRLQGVGRRARVIKSDILATNGVIHLVDTLLQPSRQTLCKQWS